ncbi:serine threonine protein kinase : Serine/threonine protein kinase-related protein OS=Planctomyces limnophilus (strain ATCC 43296 / DSM 3776 / IFAM 1008 / 290) GN=Plim_0540 PE=3 SV=1: Pkinase [Gemmata massiliana]|uniref:Protein kinase domain-containing protein n=1 Tax=Gemmata massiliana TaxID=1210884 RepID=A0A6P2CZW9_9BACT|nr:protein kinase [Gemmata massiliana]VTR93896.1 serine threonine protein kinase : Serine/threonine protein kinase-related protein OS=Planctomyces limnophilus (strain ATCC 43296 / DSM 3776 / IFAM 1008 / 290) GN=Plim_0540 PE=3 SV=1: Pkinase [Gemmata massiliana]
MANEWYIDASGRTDGPFSDDELRRRAVAGALRPADRVSRDRRTWITAETVPGLAFPQLVTIVAPSPPLLTGSAPVRPLIETVVSASSDLLDSSSEDQAFAPLDSVPGYELQGTLGTGACGIVYRAVQKKLNRVVALKTVLMARGTTDDVIARFEQEAVSLARLQHPNIVAVYDCGHTEGRAFFAMELLDGEDLSQRLAHDGPLDERTAWLVARQTAAALDHAARHGVIHRDVKPANLFLVPPPTGFPLPTGVPMVKVTDFGLALTQRGPDETEPSQTSAGLIIGTPVYMAPEQFRGGPVDALADMYSLGVTVFHVLTGRIPFDGQTVFDVMAQKVGPLPRLTAPISEPTADLVAALMAPDAKDRPASYKELITRIDALPCLDGAFSATGFSAVTPRPASSPDIALVPPAPKRKRGFIVGVAGVLLLGIAVGIAALTGAFTRAPRTAPIQPAPPATYTAGIHHALFDGRTVLPWSGKNLDIEPDAENKPVLTGRGTMTRTLPELANFNATLDLCPHDAPTVDLVLATTEGSTVQWLVRLDHTTGVAFGKRAGPTGAFESVGSTVALPTAKDRADEGLPPYMQLRYERAGGTLTAWFNRQLLGSTPAEGLRTTELRVEIKSGFIRIESAGIEELVEQK